MTWLALDRRIGIFLAFGFAAMTELCPSCLCNFPRAGMASKSDEFFPPKPLSLFIWQQHLSRAARAKDERRTKGEAAVPSEAESPLQPWLCRTVSLATVAGPLFSRCAATT